MSCFMDHALSRRLERAEGSIGTSCIAASQELRPEVGATWQDFDGTYAMFDGVESPITQTFGLGLFGPTTASSLSAIEAYLESRGAAVMHEVSPLAGLATIALLVDRGYRPHELSTVLVHAIDERMTAPTSETLCVRMIEPADFAGWIETSVAGWSEDPVIVRVIRSMAEIACANRSMTHFVVERDNAPIATASLGVHDGVALLAGASTIPAGRGLGAQAMLLAARLVEARRRGCELAMMVTEPGSTSQRNAERRGFRVAYTRTKWRLARGDGSALDGTMGGRPARSSSTRVNLLSDVDKVDVVR
ncbi:MAG: GCN5-related N-acetyltransferase [Myxococcales bacterium]|nr:GCN5-related N-acetyltransferase [Myxococcales bacterium]